MSNKMTCPGCEAHTSAVASAFDDGDACPHCGISVAVTLMILEARRRRADEDLLKQMADLGRELATVSEERNRLRSMLREVRATVSPLGE